MGKRELVALICMSSLSLAIVVWLFFTMPQVCLQFVIVVFPEHTNLLFFFLYFVLAHKAACIYAKFPFVAFWCLMM